MQNPMQNWLYQNLQKWTPFSALLVVAGAGMVFILVWDVINNIPFQASIVGILTLLLGGSGAATLFSHGVTVANGVAKDTAVAVVKQQAVQQSMQSAANTQATQENTLATQQNTQATTAKG